MDKHFIPVNTPLLSGNEEKYLLECVRTGWISSEGPFVAEFEDKFSEYVGRRHGVAVSSGSAALDIAVKAIGIKNGDEVIMPSFTIISPAYSIVRQGGVPVLVDSDATTWNMNVDEIESKITSKTKAIIVVHIYGLPVDLDPILTLAKKYDLKVIEDAAEMIGQTYKDKPCGSFGDVSVFSFYPNKHITTGEGGMIVTDDPMIMKESQLLRNLYFNPQTRFVHDDIGWNYRMTNLQAALGVAQLEQIERSLLRKREIGALYQKLLQNVPQLDLPLKKTEYSNNIYWVFGVLINKLSEQTADEVKSQLASREIGTRSFFCPMHMQPVFDKMGLFSNEEFPISEYLWQHGFYLPSGLGIKDHEIKIVAESLIEILS